MTRVICVTMGTVAPPLEYIVSQQCQPRPLLKHVAVQQ
jgi:hypothetical protein